MVTWKLKGQYKADAEKVYAEIKSLGDSFSPQSVVERAKDSSTELHKCFTWDDTKAAIKWRESEARTIMRSLVVKVEDTAGESVNVRVINTTSRNNEYKPTSLIVKNDTEYADLLARAKAELRAFKQKYATVRELQAIFDEIDLL